MKVGLVCVESKGEEISTIYWMRVSSIQHTTNTTSTSTTTTSSTTTTTTTIDTKF